MSTPGKVQKAFKDLLLTLSTNSPDRIQMLSEFLDPACNGFGTAPQEVFRDRNDWLSLFHEESVQIPNGIEVHPKWIETFQINDQTVGVYGETVFQVKLATKVVTFDPVRMSVIFKEENGELRVIHWHNSFPLGEYHDEIFPGSKEPRRYDEVSVLFADLAGFTDIVSGMQAEVLIKELNEIFARFDEISDSNALVKIKTIGDAYMAVSGLRINEKDHASNVIRAAKEMIDFLNQRRISSPYPWNLRAGIHSGPVIGGIIGLEKLQFDIWGDTVNVASRMESSGEKGKINISSQTCQLIQGKFTTVSRGKIPVKGKGEMEMFFVE